MTTESDVVRHLFARVKNIPALLESTTVAIFVYQEKGLRYVNPTCTRLTGYSREELLEMNLWELVHPEFREAARERALARLHGAAQAAARLELKFLTKGGEERWGDFMSGTVEYDGSPAGIVTGFDITERKRDEEQIRRSARFFTSVVENIPHTIFIKETKDLRYIYVNRECADLIGRSREAIVGKTDYEFFPREYADRFRSQDREVLESRGLLDIPEETVLTRRGALHMHTRKIPLLSAAGTPEYLVGISENVTERKRAEEALRESEERFRNAFDNAPVGMALVGLDGRFLQVNQSLCGILGYAKEALLARTVADVTHPDDVRAEERLQEEIRSGSVGMYGVEKRYLHADGRVVWGQLSVSLIRDVRENPLYYIGQLEDISERKRTETALRRWKDIFFHTKMAIAVAAADSDRLDLVNPAFAELHGYAVEEITGRHIADVYPPEHQAAFREAIRAAHERGHALFETVHLRKDGATFPALVDLTVVKDDDGKLMYRVANIYDLTERKRAEEALLRSEEQLRQSQKMEAMGRLAGGVAHDFNNLLTAITGYTDLVLARLGGQDPRRKEMEEIRKAAQRAAGLTSQLLAFSRKQVLRPRVFDLNEVVASLDKMLRRLIGEDIALSTSLGEGLWPVKADPGQIEQVIMNLVVNARDAMPGGGSIGIETANVIIGERDIPGEETMAPGPYVLLGVSDTGCGMDDVAKSHLFEPFFTTKEIGKGTGLGLATAYGIVKQSGGQIAVTSEVDLGTTFRIYLPRAGSADGRGRREKVPARLLQGRETILLVEDEEVVRNLIREVLAGHGYAVLEVRRTEEVQEVCDRHAGAVDLLVTDVVMPGMSGREIADLLQPRFPGMKVLYMSGYTDDAIVHHGIVSGAQAFLQKPFTPEGLARKVREVLDSGRSG